MIDVFKYEKRYWYPHMKPGDVAIWERFIAKYPNRFLTVQYDFAVGDPPPFDPTFGDGVDMNQDVLYRLKIDVVAEDENFCYVIEVKPNAGASALGQVLVYHDLYLQEKYNTKPVKTIVVSDFLRPNMAEQYQKKDVELVIV